MNALRARLALPLWIAALVAALTVLLRHGTTTVGFPPLAPGEWPEWSRSVDAGELTASVARAVAVALVVHLLAATVAQVLGTWLDRRDRGSRGGLVARVAGRAVPGFVVTLSAAIVTSSPAFAAETSEPGGTTIRAGLGARMERVTPEPPTPVDETELPGAGADAPPTGASPTGSAPPEPGTEVAEPREWLVRPGDHLWRIAEVELARTRGVADPSDLRPEDVRRYWLELTAANRDRLVDPANPDLVFPGQRFTLP